MNPSTPFAPEPFKQSILDAFEDSSCSHYAQVATVDAGKPQVRTVHLRYIPELETIGFVCNSLSKKMTGLRDAVAGCWYIESRKIQFRWEGSVQLITAETKDSRAQKVRERMWKEARESVRFVYWYQHLGIPYDQKKEVDLTKVAPTFVVAVIDPAFWDFYNLVTPEYRTHKRHQSKLKGSSWFTKPVDILTGKEIQI